MVQNHMPRLSAPKSWPLRRKAHFWVVRQHPSGHSLASSLALGVVLRDLIGCVKTLKEAKYVAHAGDVLVNGVVRCDVRSAVGFMDVVTLPKLDASYRMVYDRKGRLALITVAAKERSLRLLRVVGKTVLSGGRLQINFHDGSNLLLKDFAGSVGDSVLYDFSAKKIVEHYALAPGSAVYLCGGSGVGLVGVVTEVVVRSGARRAMLKYDVGGVAATTLLDYGFVVGAKKKPALQVVAS